MTNVGSKVKVRNNCVALICYGKVVNRDYMKRQQSVCGVFYVVRHCYECISEQMGEKLLEDRSMRDVLMT